MLYAVEVRCEEDPNGGRTSRGEARRLAWPTRAQGSLTPSLLHSLAYALLDLFMVTGIALLDGEETRKGDDIQVADMTARYNSRLNTRRIARRGLLMLDLHPSLASL